MSEQSEAAGGSLPANPADSALPIIARPGKYYRRARYLVSAMIFIFGLWFGCDGFIRWPAQTRAFEAATVAEQASMVKPHSDTDIAFNQWLVGLVPFSVVMLAFFLYRSRGEYRLEAQTLHVPGHPPVPLDRITELDRSQWERKGILFVHYALTDGASPARLKLDDFVYERKGTDAIVAALTGQLFPGDTALGE
jgi:hypothetical protein